MRWTLSRKWPSAYSVVPIRTALTSGVLTISLTGVSLLTASCGDFQDSAGSSAGTNTATSTAITEPSSSPLLQLQNQTSGAAKNFDAVDTSQPISTSDSTIPSSQTVPFTAVPPLSTQAPASSETMTPPWFAQEGPQLKPVTVTWDAPSAGSVLGYKVYIVSGSVQQTFDVGPTRTFQTVLPMGGRYYFAVSAYNDVGESARTPYVEYDLT